MQESLDPFSTVFGLTISTKTEVMYQCAASVPFIEHTVTLGGEKLDVAGKFTYPDRSLSRTVTVNEDINYRIVCASAAFSRLQASVWEKRSIGLQTKLKVITCSLCPPGCMYVRPGTVYSHHAKQLNSVHMRCLR